MILWRRHCKGIGRVKQTYIKQVNLISDDGDCKRGVAFIAPLFDKPKIPLSSCTNIVINPSTSSSFTLMLNMFTMSLQVIPVDF